MSFLIFALCGVLGGLLGGMGMGGGTALIPLLTIFCGVGQRAAQGVNLVAFLPMSAAALAVHAGKGLLERRGLLFLAAPAPLFSAVFSLLAAALPSAVLHRGFGLFLIILSIFRLKKAFFMKANDKNQKNA